MRWIDNLGRAQRVVVVVALAIAFVGVGRFLQTLSHPTLHSGWSGYAPLRLARAGHPGWLRLIVWLALTCLWAAASIRVLRPAGQDQPDG